MDRRPTSLPDPPLPLLVTGIAGVAGYNAFHYFRGKYGKDVIGIRPVNNWPLRGGGIVACNNEDRDGLTELFEKFAFRSVLNCAGSCALKACELDPGLAHRVNVDSIRAMLDVVEPNSTRFVHLSIDLVFSGTAKGGHLESDITDPVTVYGKTMSISESLIQLANPDACMLRISLPMGISFNGHAGAIDWIQSRFKKNKPATLYYDEVRTPTYTDCMNRLFRHVLAGRFRGLYHAGGTRRLSLYQIAQIINRVGGYDPDLLMGCPRIDAGPIPPRAGNVTMNSTKLSDVLGWCPFDPWPLDEELVPTDRDWHYDRSFGHPGSPDYLAEVLYHNPRSPSKA